MANIDDYNAKLDVLKAISNEEVQTLILPVEMFLREAENLFHWALDDLSELSQLGILQKVLNDLPVRAGACREA